jgi:hypothetical protein
MNLIVVPFMSISPESMKALPKAPAAALAHHLVERSNHWRILGRPVHRGFVQRRPREPHALTSFATRDMVLRHLALHCTTLDCRRYNFRDNTSLMAAFSKARSAYIRSRRLFSASSSLTRLSSLADMPAYLLFHWY